MPYLINKNNKDIQFFKDYAFEKKIDIPLKLTVVSDTEFSYTSKIRVNCMQLGIPELCKNSTLIWMHDELTPDFNPWLKGLQAFGYKVEILNPVSESELGNELLDLFYTLIDGLPPNKVIKVFKTAVDVGHFDDFLTKWNLKREYLQCVPVKRSKGEYSPELNLPKLNIDNLNFFAVADLFKILGQNHQNIYLNSPLNANRVISVKNDFCNKGLITTHPYVYINGVLHEVLIRLRDVMNRLPPFRKGLDQQCETFKTEYQKLNIETTELANKLGLKSANEIKSNMTLFERLEINTFLLYGASDIFATYSLSERQQEFLDLIRKDFGLEPVEIRDTVGSNVSRFLIDLTHKHFNATEGSSKTTVTNQRKLANADSLQKIKLNDWGVQTFQTVGGLLYSRVARYPYLKGLFADVDLESCYATKISNMNKYLGQGIITTFKGKKYKPTLKESLKVISEQKCPRDAWFIRVSGKLEKAENTLVLSDLAFTPKSIKFKTMWDKNPYQSTIEEFNAYKTSDVEAVSTLLRKEIKFGLINADILDCLKLLPDEWCEEYLNLKVDGLVFVPQDLICNTLEELELLKEKYELDEYTEKLDQKTGLKQISAIRCKANVCLSFPLSKYYEQLKNKRSEYKNAKPSNPIEQVYKVFSNSSYGALACRHLPVNNLLAANQITASARAASWLMINALNGFQVITDGCTFSWEHIPIGLKFKELLKANPAYLIDFDPSIKSGLISKDFSQSWFNENFRQHLYDFYELDKNHIPANLYDFKLKSEQFTDSKGKVHEACIFTDFHNTGSGNYSKGLNGSHILIDGTEYSFTDQHKPVKARSFRGENTELLAWYIDALEDGFKSPRIDSENQIIKFGDGCKLATKYLKEIDKIAFPCGFSQAKYKLMKLITRSQFLFLNEKQLRNFERTNQLGKLDILSKTLLTKKYWDNIKLKDLEPYGVTELKSDCNYWQYAKEHPIGVGFELLCLNRTHKGSVESVRNLISDKIQLGIENFNAALNIDKTIPLSNEFTNLFAALIVLRANTESSFKELLVNSIDEPTVTTVSKENLKTLAELRPDIWANNE